MRAESKAMDMNQIRIFHSKDQSNANEVFEYWYQAAPNAFFINDKGIENSLLHRADCPHHRGMASLGKKRKICARTTDELKNWAELKGVHFRSCKDCNPDDPSSNVTPESKYNYVLHELDKRIQPRSDYGTLAKDIETISNGVSDSTTKKTLVDARIGQGKFRTDILKLWDYRCAVTGSSTEKVIRASHIKPWWASINSERLDPKNGLLLVASLDALFDAGLISFETSGKMLVSSELSQSEQEIFGIVGGKLRKPPSVETANYLEYHRSEVFHD